MTRGSIGAAVSLALVVGLLLAPTTAPAGGRFDGNNRADDHGGIAGGHASASRQSGLHHAFPQRLLPHRFFHDRFFHHRSVPFAVIASPVVIYAPSAAYASPDYSDPPEAPDPPAAIYSGYGAAPAMFDAPPPRVVEYATGRYELRGDGVTMAYTWVWVPNPPPAPPTTPPVPPPGAQTLDESSPPLQSHLYRWTDDEGVMHLTDNWNAVPEQYRTQAKQNQPT